MIPESLKRRELDIRDAVVRRQYAVLSEKVDELRRAADGYLETLDAGHPLRREIIQWLMATTEWARVMVVTQRQTWWNQAAHLPRLGQYLKADERRPRGMCLDL
jgi:hypothetical protein